MRILLWKMQKIKYKKAFKTLEKDYSENNENFENSGDTIMAFINVEEEDEQAFDSKITKLIKNIKWFGNKNNCKRVLFHSFAHLSSSKANPEIAKEVLDRAEKRLKDVGYEVFQTPFGYLLDIELFSRGEPLTRFFKEF